MCLAGNFRCVMSGVMWRANNTPHVHMDGSVVMETAHFYKRSPQAPLFVLIRGKRKELAVNTASVCHPLILLSVSAGSSPLMFLCPRGPPPPFGPPSAAQMLLRAPASGSCFYEPISSKLCCCWGLKLFFCCSSSDNTEGENTLRSQRCQGKCSSMSGEAKRHTQTSINVSWKLFLWAVLSVFVYKDGARLDGRCLLLQLSKLWCLSDDL